MIYNELITNLVKRKKIIIIYSILVIIIYPVQSVILPTYYSKLFQVIKNNNFSLKHLNKTNH